MLKNLRSFVVSLCTDIEQIEDAVRALPHDSATAADCRDSRSAWLSGQIRRHLRGALDE